MQTLKIKTQKASRKGNYRPYGILMIHVPKNTSMDNIKGMGERLYEQLEKACNGERNAVVVVPDPYKCQWIKLR